MQPDYERSTQVYERSSLLPGKKPNIPPVTVNRRTAFPFQNECRQLYLIFLTDFLWAQLLKPERDRPRRGSPTGTQASFHSQVRFTAISSLPNLPTSDTLSHPRVLSLFLKLDIYIIFLRIAEAKEAFYQYFQWEAWNPQAVSSPCFVLRTVCRASNPRLLRLISFPTVINGKIGC
jgi:hypothetical protein